MLDRVDAVDVLRRTLAPGLAAGEWPRALRDEAAFRESGGDDGPPFLTCVELSGQRVEGDPRIHQQPAQLVRRIP